MDLFPRRLPIVRSGNAATGGSPTTQMTEGRDRCGQVKNSVRERARDQGHPTYGQHENCGSVELGLGREPHLKPPIRISANPAVATDNLALLEQGADRHARLLDPRRIAEGAPFNKNPVVRNGCFVNLGKMHRWVSQIGQ
jgi:hypothetical protein